MIDLPEYVDGLPNIAGHEDEIAKALKAAAGQEVYRPESRVDFARIKSAAAIALHMHQPLIRPEAMICARRRSSAISST